MNNLSSNTDVINYSKKVCKNYLALHSIKVLKYLKSMRLVIKEHVSNIKEMKDYLEDIVF